MTFKVIQGHEHAVVPFDRPHTIFYQYSIVTLPLFCTVNEILSLIFHSLEVTWLCTHLFRGHYITHALLPVCIYQHAKFAVPSCYDAKAKIKGEIKNGSRDPDHAPLGVMCHPKAVLLCSLAFLDKTIGHTMDVFSPFISVLCHSDWLFYGVSCPRIEMMLSIQAVRGLSRLRAPGIVPCVTLSLSTGNASFGDGLIFSSAG